MEKLGGNVIENIKCFKEEYPQRLLKIKEYPQQLYCLGNTKLLNSNRIVAIVGSRDCTEYGRKYAEIFARELSKNGICVISGLAVGIDAAAHCGAMAQVGGTIAVLGGGFKDIYPKENMWLYNKILMQNGCIITEYSENETTKASNFPKRNRIISGIADAVLVIEASHRSGSKITAGYAKSQGKKVYCIPISLDQKNISGINEIIEEGARIVTSPSKLISDLYKNEEKKEESQYSNQLSRVPEEYKTIYKALEKPCTREEIAEKLKANIEYINSMLTIMEIEEYIEQEAGGIFKRKEKNV